MKELQTREQIKKDDKWGVNSVYENDELFEKEFESVKIEIESLSDFNQGEVTVDYLKKFIDISVEMGRKLNKLYIYAHMKHDEDTSNSTYSAFHSKMQSLLNRFSEITSFFRPKLLILDEKILNNLLNNDQLSFYRQYLDNIIRFKPFTLSEKEEVILASVSEVLQGAHNSFSFLNNADMKFDDLNIDGEKMPLSHGSYLTYLENENKEIRKNAFKNMMGSYKSHENTFASILNTHIKGEIFEVKTRKFNSCIEASLFVDNVPLNVYDSLIDAVNQSLPLLHEYLDIKKNIMNLDELHLYDVYKPLAKNSGKVYSYDEAIEIILEALKPLGEEYLTILKQGLKDKWVDKYENKGKRSGAYSTGCYDTNPYILMNFNGRLSDIFTLAHEIGHSMHTYFSKRKQSPVYSDYKIFVAEVASIFNEMLLKEFLLKNSHSNDEKFNILNKFLENFRTTLFRQVMFAEYEKIIHADAENGIPLTANHLNSSYYALNKKYFGEKVNVDKEIEIEWARIPHFYYNFYVYKYAIGFATSAALSKKVLEGSTPELNSYINFLSAGSSKYPIDILKDAGVDLTTPKPVLDAVQTLKTTIEQFRKLQ